MAALFYCAVSLRISKLAITLWLVGHSEAWRDQAVGTRPRGGGRRIVSTPEWWHHGNYPQTGLEEINRDLLEADFWRGITAVSTLIRQLSMGHPILSTMSSNQSLG